MADGGRWGGIGAVLLLAAVACAAFLAFTLRCDGPEEEPPAPEIILPAQSAEEATTALFRFAVKMEEDSVVPDYLVREDLLEKHRVALLDDLEPLAGGPPPEIVDVEPFPDGKTTAVDVEFRRADGGAESWSAQAEKQEDGTWRIIWVQGPGMSWPPRKKAKGEGLSSSPI